MSKVTKADLLETFEYLVDGRRCGFGGWLATKSISHNVDTIRALIERHGDNGPGRGTPLPVEEPPDVQVKGAAGSTPAPGFPSSPDQPRPTREEVEAAFSNLEGALEWAAIGYAHKNLPSSMATDLCRNGSSAIDLLRRAVEPRKAISREVIKIIVGHIEDWEREDWGSLSWGQYVVAELRALGVEVD